MQSRAARADFELAPAANRVPPDHVPLRVVKINAVERVAQLVARDRVLVRFEQQTGIFGLQVAAAVFDDKTSNRATIGDHDHDTASPLAAQHGLAYAFDRELFVENEPAGIGAGLNLNRIARFRGGDGRLDGLKARGRRADGQSFSVRRDGEKWD